MRRRLTRRQSALLRLGVLILALVLLGTVGGYGFTPESALRQSRAFYHMEDAVTVADLGDLGLDLTPSIHRSYQGLTNQLVAKLGTNAVRGTLSATPDSLLLSACHFHPLTGWQSVGGAQVDCTDGATLHGGCLQLDWLGGDWENPYRDVLYVFGRVDAPSVVRVTVRMEGYRRWHSASGRSYQSEVELCQEVPLSGSRYFCVEMDENIPITVVKQIEFVGLDAVGNEVARVEGEWFASLLDKSDY